MALDEYKPQSGGSELEERNFKYVGTRPDRPDGLDKVTGRARFGADAHAPGMLHAAVVRSPHAHARIVKIDSSKAEALDGVKAVVTRADFSDQVPFAPGMEGEFWNVLENVMAGDKALYDGHAVAAVAATSALAARDALKLIEVEYEILPHVTDVDKAMQSDAPVIREGAADYSVPEGMHPNVVRMHESGHGDVAAGFAEADLVVEDRLYQTGHRRKDHVGIATRAAFARQRIDQTKAITIAPEHGQFIPSPGYPRLYPRGIGPLRQADALPALHTRTTPHRLARGFLQSSDLGSIRPRLVPWRSLS